MQVSSKRYLHLKENVIDMFLTSVIYKTFFISKFNLITFLLINSDVLIQCRKTRSHKFKRETCAGQ